MAVFRTRSNTAQVTVIRDHLTEAWHTVVPPRNDPFGPLPSFLVILTVVTGLVDAFSYLDLGHVFMANMTGNVVFLAFALAGASGFSVAGSVVALGAFALGSTVGGRTAAVFTERRGRMLRAAASVEAVLVVIAIALSAASGQGTSGGFRYGIIVLLGVAMGVQNATARKMAVPDLTTTVLTQTSAGLFADMKLIGGTGSKAGRRLVSVLAMFVGAVIGATLVVHGSKTLALVVAFALVAPVALIAGMLSRGRPSWDRP